MSGAIRKAINLNVWIKAWKRLMEVVWMSKGGQEGLIRRSYVKIGLKVRQIDVQLSKVGF